MQGWASALGLGLAVSAVLLVIGCGSSTPTPPNAITPAPPPRLSATPSPAPPPTTMASPTAGGTVTPGVTQVPTPTIRIYEGWLPGPALVSAVQEPTDIQLTLRTMTQLSDLLRSLALGQPSKEDLVTVTQQTASLMTQVQQQMPLMTTTQQQQAFQLEQELMEDSYHVQSAYIYHSNSTGPTTSQGTPSTIPGTPLVVIGTPAPVAQSSLPSSVQLISQSLQQLQLNAADMAKGHPDDGDITTWLVSMESDLSSIRQLAPQLSPQDLQQLAAGVAQAMTAMVGAMQAYVSS